ncbi:RHS repeat-associated core domain-containing protein [Actinokineospora sp. 24-640]
MTRTVNRYDTHGNMISSKQRVFAIDGLLPGLAETDRLVQNTQMDPSGVAESIEYRSHGASLVSPPLTFNGVNIDYGYDRDGSQNLASWKINGQDLTVINTTNTAGLTTSRVVNANNTGAFASPQVTYGYDRYGRLALLSARNNNVQRYRQTLNYADNGMISNATEQLGDTTKPVNTTAYAYDHRHQLVTATRTGGELTYTGAFTHTPGGRMATSQITAQRAPAYPDSIGERVTTRNVDHVYNPTDLQQLDKLRKPDLADYTSYQYDNAGNTTKRTLSDGTVIDQVWDGSGLRKVTKPGTGETETYFYDGHQRVAAVLRNPDGTVNTIRRWFGAMEVIHQPGKAPLYRQNIGMGGETIARHDGDEVTGTTQHVMTSPQGHPVLALKTDGSTARVASFGPFGEVLSEFTTIANFADFDKYTEEFNGKTYDPASGLHYYGHRYYDSEALQWTSGDPLYRHNPDLTPTNPRTANLYTYTGNNPVNFVDPNGLCYVQAKTGMGDCDFGGEDSLGTAVNEAAEATEDLLMDIATELNQPIAPGSDQTWLGVLSDVAVGAAEGSGGGHGPGPKPATRPSGGADGGGGGGPKKPKNRDGEVVLKQASTKDSDDSVDMTSNTRNIDNKDDLPKKTQSESDHFSSAYLEPNEKGVYPIEKLHTEMRGKTPDQAAKHLGEHISNNNGSPVTPIVDVFGQTIYLDPKTGGMWRVNDREVAYFHPGAGLHWNPLYLFE